MDTHLGSANRPRSQPTYLNSVEAIDSLPQGEHTALAAVADRYAFRVSDYYLNLIDWADPTDPLRRLVIPDPGELDEWGRLDASNEGAVTVTRGVQHKYGSTVVLLVTESCASFCRYCFRKRLFLADACETDVDIDEGLAYIREHDEITNVLVTGGDPLMLSTARLEKIITALTEIDHVRIIRIGSKMPAFNPHRILNDRALTDMLRQNFRHGCRIYLMCHFDHPRELTPEARRAMRRFQQARVVCVNQNPIIRGISDNVETMATLWRELSYIGIPQYYVFQNRPTVGNKPYTVPIVEAYFLVEEAKRYCSGLAKRVRHVMSHESGKAEIVGVDQDNIYLKYHRAKYRRDEQRFFICRRNDSAYWLDQLEPAAGQTNEYYQGAPAPDSASAVPDNDC